MKTIAATLAFAAVATWVLAMPASAHGHHHSHNSGPSRGNQGNFQAFDSPWLYPNCILYSPRLRNYVWICGSPYPTEMPHT